MKKDLRRFWVFCFMLVYAGFTQKAKATHWQGSELTYITLAPNVYNVNLKLYRDCSGSPPATTANLNIKSPGCNPGRDIPMSQMGSVTMGNPYCPQLGPAVCTLTGRSNYEEVIFNTTVSFTPVEQGCTEWLLSWSECCRPSVRNFATKNNYSFYAEAMIRLGGGVINNSPQFGSLVVPYVNYKQPILLSSHAIDSDGDSLVYRLEDPLESPITPIPFGPYYTNLVYSPDSTKYTLLPSGNYSKTFPVLSYAIDWNLPMPITPIPKFMFDTKTGSIGFIPYRYIPNSPSSQGENKYVFVVQVDEFRKVNGAVVKVGSVRRDMFLTVIDCGPNQNPVVNSPVANGQSISDNDVINLRPVTPLNLQFATADGNATNQLTVTSDVAQVLPGATLTLGSGNQPTGTISWTPSANQVRNQIYYFHITVQDDACPVKGYQTHTFGVKVSATGGVTGIAELSKVSKFLAYPNPFAETVTFKLNITKGAEQQLVIYNALGQQVDKIALNCLASGEQNVVWKNAAKMANGQYVAKLISNKTEIQNIKFTKLQ